MPDELDTDRGGFYVNSGDLAFKPAANFERPNDTLKIPKAKKVQHSILIENPRTII